jgi:hypothetical protein
MSPILQASQMSLTSDELVEQVRPAYDRLQQGVQRVVARIAELKQ